MRTLGIVRRLVGCRKVVATLDAHADATTESSEVRNTSDLWAWMNTWGDLYEWDLSGERRRGYERAIQDLLVRLREMGVENCSEKSWRRFTGRG